MLREGDFCYQADITMYFGVLPARIHIAIVLNCKKEYILRKF